MSEPGLIERLTKLEARVDGLELALTALSATVAALAGDVAKIRSTNIVTKLDMPKDVLDTATNEVSERRLVGAWAKTQGYYWGIRDGHQGSGVFGVIVFSASPG
jgi:hypothetical protein